jgi:hypothetical protein
MVCLERERLAKPLPQAYKVFRMRTLSLDFPIDFLLQYK